MAAIQPGVDPSTGEVFNDTDRPAQLQPGHLVYSAKMNRSKLECLYCLNPRFGPYCWMLCAKKEMAARSYLDIYTDGITTNAPLGCACCYFIDNVQRIHWDDSRIGNAGAAGCCKPYPCLCPHGCNCCGEVVYFFRMFGCCFPACLPMGNGHLCQCLSLCCCSCCITDLFCGLQEGEAEKIASYTELGKARQLVAVKRPEGANAVLPPWVASMAPAPMVGNLVTPKDPAGQA